MKLDSLTDMFISCKQNKTELTYDIEFKKGYDRLYCLSKRGVKTYD